MTALVFARLNVIAMTDTRTVVAHLITDDAVAEGRHAGRYVGVCGALVLPGSLKEETSEYCRACWHWAATNDTGERRQGRHDD